MTPKEAVRRAYEAVLDRRSRQGSIARAEVDQNDVVFVYDDRGVLLLYCHLTHWKQALKTLGIDGPELVRVHRETVDDGGRKTK